MKKLAAVLTIIASITLNRPSQTQAAQFITYTADISGSSIQIQFSEQDLERDFFQLRVEPIMEFPDQEFQPMTVVLSWGDTSVTYAGAQYFRDEVIQMSPIRDAGATTVMVAVATPMPFGFRIKLADFGDLWAEFRLKKGWVFSQIFQPTKFPVWDTQMTEWDQDMTLILPEEMTEDETVVLKFDHSQNSRLDGPVYVGWNRNGLDLTLELDQNGKLEIPLKDIFTWRKASRLTINTDGFGGNVKTGWLWYTVTIPETGQTAIFVHAGYAVRTWYADHKPADPIAYILGTVEETAVEASSWGQVKARMK